MIYTIGFNQIPCTTAITLDYDFSSVDPSNTFLFIDATAPDREQWKRMTPFAPTFELLGILPNQKQSEDIYHFLQQGGVVVSSLVNPDRHIVTAAYSQEVPINCREELRVKGDGCTIEFDYHPYDWLLRDLSGLPTKAYKIYSNEEQDHRLKATIHKKIESITFDVGQKGGKVIFSTLLNKGNGNFHHVKDFLNTIYSLDREEKVDVASR